MDAVNPTGKHRKQTRHHGEGSVPFRRKDGYSRVPWRCALTAGTKPNGRPLQLWFSGASPAEAEQKRDAARRALARSLHPQAATMTVRDVVSRYLSTVRPPSTRPTTYDRYEGICLNYLNPSLGNVRLWSLDQAQIRRAMSSWGGAAQKAICLSRLRAVLKLAVSERLVERNEAEYVKPPKAVVREAPTITPADARKILEAFAGHRLYPLVLLALGCGLRRGELLGLHWADVDLEQAQLIVRWSLRYIPREWRTPAEFAAEQTTRLVEPKTSRSRRVLPIPEIAVDGLKALQAQQALERRSTKVWAENDLVFCDPLGNSLSPKTVTYLEVRLRKIVPGLRLHDLRSGFATLLAFQDVHPRVAQGMMGHVNIGQSMDYTKVVPAAAREAADRIDSALRRAK